MTTYRMRPFILAIILLLFATLAHATTIGSVSGSTVTLTAGKVDGVQVGMTALVYGIATIEGKATEVPIAKVQVTAVNDRSCTATILRALTTATTLRVSEGQKVMFQQALVPPAGKRAGEADKATPQPRPSPSKDPYAGLSPLELSEKADAAYSAERFDEAEELYSAVLRAVPDDPLSSQRLKELSGRKQQAEAEARQRAETAENLKNADFFLTRGDDAYRANDYVLAASYYTKVAEVDESYRDAGVKYWLSKALAAKAKGDTVALREAMGKLKGMTLPESLKEDLAALGPNAGDVRINSKDGLEYVYIPPGTFQMGCVSRDSGCDDNEKPRHAVTISREFWMCKTEVTVGAYKRFCSAIGRAMPPAPPSNPNWQSEDHPMVNVNWNDAQAYCVWAGGRLPTEAQWEYAARAGTETVYYWGDNPDGAYAWDALNSGKQTHPVGQKRANEWGLYDMSGNVWEWCSDWCADADRYYTGSPGIDPSGPGKGKTRALRGGGFFQNSNFLRMSVRGRFPPEVRNGQVGFRCLRDASP